MNIATIRCLAAFALCVLCGSAAAADIRVKLGTGGDDLRGGNDNVHVRVLDNDGREIGRVDNANHLKRLADHTVFTVPIRLNGSARVKDVGAIELITTFGGGIAGDNWNLDILEVTAPGSEHGTLIDLRGAPLFRFTGTQKVRRFPVVIHQCNVDADCDNDLSGDGAEHCSAKPRALDGKPLRACVAGTPPPACEPGMEWDEGIDGCRRIPRDEDGDGVVAVRDGGNDCDDHDAKRSPGNTEICDADGHDADCDVETGGARDADGDGYSSNVCFNWGPARER